MSKTKNSKRIVYLIRHGKPEFPDNKKRCIGRTDLALSQDGMLQAGQLTEFFYKNPVERVFTSPLIRCRRTADILAAGRIPVSEEEGLIELDMGEWENLPMNEIKKELESEPVYGEKRSEGLERIKNTIQVLLKNTSGDIACVSHAGINCCYLSFCLGTPLETSRVLPQPYGGISCLETDGNGVLSVKSVGRMPKAFPDPAECEEIWEHYHTPEGVRAHCRKVCERAMDIAKRLNEDKRNPRLNPGLIQSASLLHDVARDKRDHAKAGADILIREGYPEIAEIIAVHHDLTVNEILQHIFPNEAEVVYLADKLVQGTKDVTIEERFSKSLKKCMEDKCPEEAMEAHNRRYETAKTIEKKINYYLGKR